MSAKENEEVVRRFYNISKTGDFSILDELYAPDYVRNDLREGQVSGPQGQKLILGAFRAAFPDAKTTIHQLIATDEFVVGRWTIEGTNTGPWGNFEPTGKTMVYKGVNIFRFENGKIAELWNFRDDLGLYQQIGLPIHGGVPDK